MDRGEGYEFTFRRCERGFIITHQPAPGMLGSMWAFDNIRDAADWIVAQWDINLAQNGDAR